MTQDKRQPVPEGLHSILILEVTEVGLAHFECE